MNIKKYFKVGLLFITLFIPSFLYSQNFGYYATAVWFEQVGVSNQFLNISSKNYIYTAQQNAVNQGNGDWTSIKFHNFGSFVANSGTLLFRGAEVRTFKKSNGNICTPELDYMIYPTGNAPYSTTTLLLGSVQSCDLTTQTYPDGLGPCSLSGFQKWQTLSLSPNAPLLDLTKYPEGSYTIELYFTIHGSSIDPNGCNEFVLDDNGGLNYKATFQICPTMSFTSKTDPAACGGNGTITMSINGVPDSTYSDRFYYEDATNTTHLFTNVKVQSNVATVFVPSGTYNNIRYWKTSGCGPTTGFNVVINEPSVPNTPVIGTITQPTCALPTGSVQLSSLPSGAWTLTPSVGNPITGSGSSFVFTGLTPSTNYTFTVSDAFSCTSAPTSTVSINALQIPAVPTTTSIIQPTCAIQTGTITIATQSGVEYSINGTTWQSSNIFSGLTPGTYFYSVRNLVDNTCSVTSATPAVINALPIPPSVPTASGIIQPTCGTPTGTITITAQSGVEYSLNGTTWQSSNVFKNLAPANYTLYVHSIADNTCINTSATSVVINAVPNAPSIPVTSNLVQPTCAIQTGSLTIASQTGVEYSIDGIKWQSSNSFSGLMPGSSITLYVRNISDSTCISASANAVAINAIPAPPAIPTAQLTQPTCAVQTGTITIATQSGVEYSINGTTWQSSNTFSALTPGSYPLFVRNKGDNTCFTESASNAVINALPIPPSVPTASGIIQPTCAVQTGSLTITPQSDVEYSLNGTKWQKNNTISGILPGNYSYFVRHISDTTCMNQSASTITINPIPNAPSVPTALSIVQPTCGTPTGSITITTQNGVEYSIDGTNWQASNVFSGLAQGSSLTLYVRKTADNTCINFSTAPVQLVIPSVPATPTAVVVQPTCAVQTGSLSIAPQTGVEYSIDGSNWQSGNTFGNLMPGSSFTLYVRKTTDASCINTSVSVLAINALPTPPATPTATLIQPTCAVQSGTITIASQTGVEYSINGTNWQTSNLFSSLAPGSYPLFVRNISDNTCISQSASNVVITAIPTPPDVPTVSSVVQPTCALPTGTITIAAQTGIDYSIDGTNWQSGNVFTGLLPGSYTVYAREKANPTCFQTSAAFIYEVICANDDVFQPVSSQTGGIVGNIFANDYFNNNPLDPSTVNLTLSLPSGMSVDANGNITVNAQTPEGTYSFMYSICEKLHPDNCDTATVKVQVTDFTKFISFTKTATTPQLSKDGTYSLIYTLTGKNKSASTIQDIQMEDDLAKTFPSPISFNVESIMGGDKLKANSQFDGKTDLNTLMGSGKLDASESDSIKIYIKLNPNGFEGTVSNQAAFNALSSGKGPINNLLSDDPTGVGANLRPTISLIQKIELFIPDAFSPNGDGFNDKFVIIHSSVYSINLKVFNRWGNIVYQNNNYQNDWDGKGTGLFSNQELPNGTYYYVIELVDSQGGKNQLFKGYLTLRR
jgi:gliding motility-associated-like protein